jgi:hypothetical protein
VFQMQGNPDAVLVTHACKLIGARAKLRFVE